MVHKASRLDDLDTSLVRRVLAAAPEDAIDLGLGEPGMGPPVSVRSTLQSFLDEPRGYSPNAGYPELREAVARYLKEPRGADAVCVTVGSQEALFATLMAFIEPGDEVLVPDPGYPAYPAVVRLAGGVAVAYRLPEEKAFTFVPAEVEKRLSPRTRAILVNTPANPSGTILSRQDLEGLAALARDRDLLLVSDEVYREIYFEEPPPSLLDVTPDGVVVGGLSKCAGLTGWRLGWAASSPERIAAINVVHQYIALCAPSPSQLIALDVLGDLAAVELPARRELYRSRRNLMKELVERELDLPYVSPQGAYYMLVKAAADGRSLELSLDLLHRAGVVTIPGVAFGQEAARYLRLSFSADEPTIREAMHRLRRALRPP